MVGGGGGSGGGGGVNNIFSHFLIWCRDINIMSAEHKCERCGNDFARRDSLARHKKTKV